MKRLALLLAALTVLLPLIRGVTINHEHFTLPEEEFMPVFEAIELLKDQMKGLEDSARKEINLYVLHSPGLEISHVVLQYADFPLTVIHCIKQHRQIRNERASTAYAILSFPS